VDWAELLSSTFEFDVFACVRCGAPGLAHGMCEHGPGARATPGCAVLRLKTAKGPKPLPCT
jgi:hypothetical protein